jgi:large subunit ribosomal protein L4
MLSKIFQRSCCVSKALRPSGVWSGRALCTSNVQLPPNVELVSSDILETMPEPIIDEIKYLFGDLDVPQMAIVKSWKIPGQSVGETALDPTVFGVAIRKDIVSQVVRYMRAKIRQPQKTKRLWEISGSNKKPRPQKGQGKSQVGHIRNSAWRGGQKAHGPVLRDFSFSLNKKYRAMGLMITLAAKLREGNLHVFDSLKCDSLRTKDFLEQLKSHHLIKDGPERLLIVDLELDDNMEKACRNLPNVTPVVVEGTNVLNIVKNDVLVLSESALKELVDRVIAQYTHLQKRKAYLAGLQEIKDAQD